MTYRNRNWNSMLVENSGYEEIISDLQTTHRVQNVYRLNDHGKRGIVEIKSSSESDSWERLLVEILKIGVGTDTILRLLIVEHTRKYEKNK